MAWPSGRELSRAQLSHSRNSLKGVYIGDHVGECYGGYSGGY